MFRIIKADTRFDFMGQAPVFAKVSIGLFLAALVYIFGVGMKFGLDFSGGHEVLLQFDKPVSVREVRDGLQGLPVGDTSVQSFEIPDSTKTHFLVRVQRAETLDEAQLASVEGAFKTKYGEHVKGLGYNKEIGNVLDVEFTATATASGADTSTVTIASLIESKGFRVRNVKQIGRADQTLFSVTLRGVDTKLVEALTSLDPSVHAVRVEFVGPTVGKQLRDDGILAVLYALLCILIYIALRFDFFFGPGAVVCLFHDAIITVAILGLIGHEFSLATIAGLLTLVGYSINDTIVVFDRIRETVSRVQGQGLAEILNRAINETLGRTLMTSLTTLVACICLMVFGRSTVLFDFGLIMGIGVVVGTYSSIYVAAPMFRVLRERFGPKDPRTVTKAKSAAGAPAKSGA